MRFVLVALLFVSHSMVGETVAIEDRTVPHFYVEEESRLAALARLGAQMRLSLLVETGQMKFLQSPVTVASNGSTVREIMGMILKGPTPYTIKSEGSLIVISATRGHNRVLTMPLGAISYSGRSLSFIYTVLAVRVSEASGCLVRGYVTSGMSLDLVVPAIKLPSATFAQIVTRVADAAEPSMWVVEREPSTHGCIANPAAHWEVGLYSFGSSFSDCEARFKASIGHSFVPFQASRQPESTRCYEPRIPESVPTLPR